MNFAAAFKDEVVRLTRKELKKELAPLKKQTTSLRRLVAKQRRQITELARAAGVKSVTDAAEGAAVLREVDEKKAGAARMGPTLIRAQRKRLKLTQAELAKLIGVTPFCIAQWERGATSPREANKAKLVAVRELKRAEAWQAVGKKYEKRHGPRPRR